MRINMHIFSHVGTHIHNHTHTRTHWHTHVNTVCENSGSAASFPPASSRTCLALPLFSIKRFWKRWEGRQRQKYKTPSGRLDVYFPTVPPSQQKTNTADAVWKKTRKSSRVRQRVAGHGSVETQTRRQHSALSGGGCFSGTHHLPRTHKHALRRNPYTSVVLKACVQLECVLMLCENNKILHVQSHKKMVWVESFSLAALP